MKLDLSTRDTKVSVDNFPVSNRQLERKKEKKGGLTSVVLFFHFTKRETKSLAAKTSFEDLKIRNSNVLDS